MKLTKNDVLKIIIGGFIIAFVFNLSSFFGTCENISNQVLRLHVIANSDTKEDQQVKLKVRDAVLLEASKWYGDNVKTLNDANTAICTHLQSIEKAANAALLENNSEKTATAQVTDMMFSTRDYENITLPAGEYRTLRITIGDGEGKNWWCIAFPELCIPFSDKTDKDVASYLPKDENEIVSNPNEYKVKFKLLEIYESLKKKFQ